MRDTHDITQINIPNNIALMSVFGILDRKTQFKWP